jgi:hypothetical protein
MNERMNVPNRKNIVASNDDVAVTSLGGDGARAFPKRMEYTTPDDT